jgi:hypothetical protein
VYRYAVKSYHLLRGFAAQYAAAWAACSAWVGTYCKRAARQAWRATGSKATTRPPYL